METLTTISQECLNEANADNTKNNLTTLTRHDRGVVSKTQHNCEGFSELDNTIMKV